MKGYKWFIVIFVLMLTLYVVAEASRPDPVNWEVTLSKDDKNPFGSYILYNELKTLFPSAPLTSYRLPAYDQANNYGGNHSGYILIAPELDLQAEDINALMNYAVTGNYVFLASDNFSQAFLDSMRFMVSRKPDMLKADSSSINFSNPLLRAPSNYTFKKRTLDTYINKYDTVHHVVLGVNESNDPNFIKVPYGEGAFYIHVAPLCFSNYFMMTGRNANYVSAALSYLPEDVEALFWDEYYKLGPEGVRSPLRFILDNVYLRWSYRIALVTLLLFILFEMKRRQRVIPVIPALKNSTLDFVNTVGSVYFNQRDNKNIAEKKISYFFEWLRSKFYIITNIPDEELAPLVAKKTGVHEQEIKNLMAMIYNVQHGKSVSDSTLLQLNTLMEDFYKKAN